MSHERAEALADHTGTLSRELAAERERRLEAELQAEQLREGLEQSRRDSHAAIAKARETAKDGCGLCRELALQLARCHAVLTAPPPSLDPLRELVRAARDVARLPPGRYFTQHSPFPRLADRLDALLALYPFLGEAEGEVKR